MRSYQSVIAEFELMVSAPAVVADCLKCRAGRDRETLRADPIDRKAEEALRGRRDPLIDIALAKYARFTQAVLPLFQESAPDSALRLAILANTHLEHGEDGWPGLPVGLFGDEGAAADWLASAPDLERRALFENPKLDNSFLRDLLDGVAPWDRIPDEKLAIIVLTLAQNERMRIPCDVEEVADVPGAQEYNEVFEAGWRLAVRVPVTELWALALSRLYAHMVAAAGSLLAPLEIARRWQVDPEDGAERWREADGLRQGELRPFPGVRKGLARLAMHRDPEIIGRLLASDDPALRSAAYAHGRLDCGQLRLAFEAEGALLFNQALRNPDIWRSAGKRNTLWELAKLRFGDDASPDHTAIIDYRDMRLQMSRRHPEWFAADTQPDQR